MSPWFAMLASIVVVSAPLKLTACRNRNSFLAVDSRTSSLQGRKQLESHGIPGAASVCLTLEKKASDLNHGCVLSSSCFSVSTLIFFRRGICLQQFVVPWEVLPLFREECGFHTIVLCSASKEKGLTVRAITNHIVSSTGHVILGVRDISCVGR